MKISNLQLKKYFFPLILISSKQRAEASSIEVDKGFGTIFWPTDYLIVSKTMFGDPQERPGMYIVDLRVESGRNPGPYEFALQCVGEFFVDPGYDTEKVDSLVSVNGASILYSASRELLLDHSAKSPYGSITLPTIGFDADKQERVCPQGLKSLMDASEV